MLACNPREPFNAKSLARRTIYPARSIMQRDWNIPKRNMTKKTNIPSVSVSGRRAACPTTNTIPGIGTNFGNEPLAPLCDGMYSKTLQIDCLFDYLFYKHEFVFG
jgi:hypothetical protein